MMTLPGHIINGTIVLDEPVSLPEGAAVRVEIMGKAGPIELPDAENGRSSEGESLAQVLLQFAGKAKGLPSDLARCHDHYIHGTPRE